MKRFQRVYIERLNLFWLVVLCFVVFLAGMAFQSFGDSRAYAGYLCAKCQEPVEPSDGCLVFHKGCRSAVSREYGASPEGQALTQTLREQMAQVLRGCEDRSQSQHNMERDPGGPQPGR